MVATKKKALNALNRIDEFASEAVRDNDNGEAQKLEKDYNLVFNFINGVNEDEATFQERLRKAKVCSICFRKYKEYGNNASPINTGTCCNNCNAGAVIPARINSMSTRKLLQTK